MDTDIKAQSALIAEIDYIEVDMPSAERSSCGACDDARSRLDQAISSVSPVLDQLGVVTKVRHLKVRTAREAELLKVRGSPSMRIGNRDLYPEHRSQNGEARVWRWRGGEFSAPPVEMVAQALLQAAANPEGLTQRDYEIPDYLLKFVAEDIAA